MFSLVKPLLFSMSAEAAHDLTMDGLSALGRLGLVSLAAKRRVDDPFTCMGLNFPNRVGLAAGLDKNGVAIDAFGAMGFGSVEVGTVTPRPQPGNPKPRLFRLEKHGAIINRMGFNNAGVDAMVEVYAFSDYVTVNLSSPNTPGLRELQFGSKLDELLAQLRERQLQLQGQHQRYVPVAVKLAPDMTDDELCEVAEQIIASELDAIIATNTTLDRSAVADDPLASEAGGLSGSPLTNKAQHCCHILAKQIDKRVPLIGVGGIDSGEAAAERIAAGADLVQIYSSFIYQGPELIKDAAKAIKELKS